MFRTLFEIIRNIIPRVKFKGSSEGHIDKSRKITLYMEWSCFNWSKNIEKIKKRINKVIS